MSNVQLINRRDIDFILDDVLNIETLLQTEHYEQYDRSTIAAILDTANSIAEENFWPHAASIDANEADFDGVNVSTPDEVKQGLNAYREAGLFPASFDEDAGGMQLPWTVYQAMCSYFTAASPSTFNYAFLTIANANMLNALGSPALKEKFLPKLVAGEWFGTMCLSETQAGSSLADIRTKATPTEAGHYLIEGTKMWISGGDQDITDNIVHMVLAKIPGSPAGVKGISLFLVPKHRVNDDGSLGDFNNIVLAGINHKMGHRGTTNTLLNFGESGECRGYLVGEANQGMQNMFLMMNEARIGVGIGAATLGLAGYHYSLDYARNRPQGRPLKDRDPESPQINIIEHADVKRMLLEQKCYTEGGFALCLYTALLIDAAKSGLMPHDQADLLLGILTPMVKSWPSEYCLEANKLAIQVLGGYGYTREYPVERLYRDNRLNHIHEGTHAIHGIDLLGRKVKMYDGAAFKLLNKTMRATIEDTKDSSLLDCAAKLEQAIQKIEATVEVVSKCDDPDVAMANATRFLDAFGHVVIAWIWLKQANAANNSLGKHPDDAFLKGKVAACHFFYRHLLPQIYPALELVNSLDDSALRFDQLQFTGN